MYKVIYYIGWVLSLLPLQLMYGFSAILSFLIYRLSLYRKQVVISNLKKSFPDKSEKEIRIIAKGFYRHFIDQIMESFRLMHMSPQRILRHMHYDNPELLEEYYRKGQSVLLLTAHYGNWEWMVSLPLITKHKVLVVFKPPNNKGFHWVYTRFGAKYGGLPVTLQNYPRMLLEHRARKESTATFILNDQRPEKRKGLYWNTFLNQDTAWENGVEKLARKTNHAVVFIQLKMRKRGQYHIRFHTLSEEPAQTAPNEITEAYSRILEESIHSRPEIWLWSHKRWKRSRI